MGKVRPKKKPPSTVKNDLKKKTPWAKLEKMSTDEEPPQLVHSLISRKTFDVGSCLPSPMSPDDLEFNSDNPEENIEIYVKDYREVFGPEMITIGPITVPCEPMLQVVGSRTVNEIKRFNKAGDPFIVTCDVFGVVYSFCLEVSIEELFEQRLQQRSTTYDSPEEKEKRKKNEDDFNVKMTVTHVAKTKEKGANPKVQGLTRKRPSSGPPAIGPTKKSQKKVDNPNAVVKKKNVSKSKIKGTKSKDQGLTRKRPSSEPPAKKSTKKNQKKVTNPNVVAKPAGQKSVKGSHGKVVKLTEKINKKGAKPKVVAKVEKGQKQVKVGKLKDQETNKKGAKSNVVGKIEKVLKSKKKTPV